MKGNRAEQSRRLDLLCGDTAMDTDSMFVVAMTDKFTNNIREYGWGDTFRLYEFMVGSTDNKLVREQLREALSNASSCE